MPRSLRPIAVDVIEAYGFHLSALTKRAVRNPRGTSDAYATRDHYYTHCRSLRLSDFTYKDSPSTAEIRK